MEDKTVSKARKSISQWLDRLREINPKAVKFNDPEIESLQEGVAAIVLDLFGRDSMEFDRFHEFRICHGNWSLMDPPSEKQIKFERGFPRAIEEMEELLGLLDSMHPLPGGEPPEAALMEAEIVSDAGEKPSKQKKAPLPSPPGKPVKEKAAAPSKPAPVPVSKAAAEPPPSPKKETGKASKVPVRKAGGKGKILLLHSGEDEMTLDVIEILDRLNLDTAIPDDSGDNAPSFLQEIAGRQDDRFALFILSADEKSLFGALPGKIVKGKSRQGDVFELGFLAGKLGPGRVGVLFRRDKGLDIPPDLFGVSYIAFEDGGGWKISLVKLLKSAGFDVDANVLFE